MLAPTTPPTTTTTPPPPTHHQRTLGLPLFAKGEAVRRADGTGPIMTVQGFGPQAHMVSCRWFDGATLRGDTFDARDLVLYVPTGGGRSGGGGYRTK